MQGGIYSLLQNVLGGENLFLLLFKLSQYAKYIASLTSFIAGSQQASV